jgi:hypothetical protein
MHCIRKVALAIALGKFSAEMKVRQRKAWGLLALGMSTGLQITEASKALNEVSNIIVLSENMEDDISQLRSSMKFLVDERNIMPGIISKDPQKYYFPIKSNIKINFKSFF